MKTTKMIKLQSLIKTFEKNILFNSANDENEILATFIDHKDKERRIIIILKDNCDSKKINSIVKLHFGHVDYKVIKRKGFPEETATLLTGKGIKHINSPFIGTLGGIFKRSNHDGRLYGLSNTHVIADANNTQEGDTCVYHPNLNAGKLFRWYILKKPPLINKMDAAIFEINDNHEAKWFPFKPKKWIGPKINLKVYKNGYTTNITHGKIKSYNGSAVVKLNGRKFYFSGIIAIKGNSGQFNSDGDSGSIVLTENGHFMVGLIFAKYHDYCWALPISRIRPLLS